jgi:glycolate oxidase FAD binding subunit
MAALASVEDQIRAVVGADHVRPTQPHETVRGVTARFIAEPGSDEETAAILRPANDAGLVVIPRGGGTKLDWGNPPTRADLILSLRRLDKVVQHAWADMTVTVQAGCTVSRLQDALAQHGQRLAVDPLWPGRATIGGILATNDSGALRLRYGALRDLIIGVTVALADGTLAASGGRVVKNVAGYDLSKLMTGALGTLGVIAQATFRVHPLPHATRTLSFTVASFNQMQRSFDAIQDSTLAHAALQARLGSDAAPVVDVLLEGTEEGIAAQEAGVRQLANDANLFTHDPSAWSAREGLWAGDDCAIVKLSVLPSDLARAMQHVADLASSQDIKVQAVMQATGLGLLRLDGHAPALREVLREVRERAERSGGSLVVLRQPHGVEQLETWGDAGDALAPMRALRRQLDPRGTLNPGRFVGGI